MKVVKRKYKAIQSEYEKFLFIAVSSIYGIDIQEDNIQESIERLYKYIEKEYKKLFKISFDEDFLKSIKYVLENNLVIGDGLSCLKNDVDYEHFSRSVLIDYILSLDIDDRIKEKLQERTSWLYLKANANASDSDFYLSRNMSSVHVYKANLRMYSELLKNFGINESMIMSLTCEEIIRIKNSPEYLKFISSYVQIVNDIYFEQQDIMEKANKKIVCRNNLSNK